MSDDIGSNEMSAPSAPATVSDNSNNNPSSCSSSEMSTPTTAESSGVSDSASSTPANDSVTDVGSEPVSTDASTGGEPTTSSEQPPQSSQVDDTTKDTSEPDLSALSDEPDVGSQDKDTSEHDTDISMAEALKKQTQSSENGEINDPEGQKKPHISPSDLEPHHTIKNSDGKVVGHAYPDDSVKDFSIDGSLNWMNPNDEKPRVVDQILEPHKGKNETSHGEDEPDLSALSDESE